MSSSAFGPTIAVGYELMGTADFNGNGKPDDVLYNASTRRTALYYLNNNVYAGSALGPSSSRGLEPGRALKRRKTNYAELA